MYAFDWLGQNLLRKSSTSAINTLIQIFVLWLFFQCKFKAVISTWTWSVSKAIANFVTSYGMQSTLPKCNLEPSSSRLPIKARLKIWSLLTNGFWLGCRHVLICAIMDSMNMIFPPLPLQSTISGYMSSVMCIWRRLNL